MSKKLTREKLYDNIEHLKERIVLLEELLDQADQEDFFGTEGWRHQIDDK